ncbi:hypothetical protein ACFXAS_17875 [Streptomyces sp. NPDC059459]|uniref:hypothetical protein n=1 Tax=Streptomyces sp. NPDC059459 TaxID=3346839 RepID=UPI0036B86A75
MTVPEDSNMAPPADYRLLMPEGWFRLDIDPERRERSVDALVNRRFEGTDNVPHIKRQLRQDLLAQAAAAFREGGIELYLSLQQAGPLTIPASLLIIFLPAPSSGTSPSLEAVANRLASDGQSEVEILELAAGPAVRVRRATGGPEQAPPAGLPGEAEEALPSVTLDYQVSVPGTGSYVLMTFSTPLVQIADAMVELFDAVAGSLTWIDGDGTGE